MDWGTVFELLQQWLAPTGCIAMAIGWWRDRRLVKVRAVKENEGTYKLLFDDLSETTLHFSDQFRIVNEKIIVLEQALRKCYQCKYAERCPAVVWMRSKQGEPNSRPLGRSSEERNRGNNLRQGPDDSDEPGTETRAPPDDRRPSGRHGRDGAACVAVFEGRFLQGMLRVLHGRLTCQAGDYRKGDLGYEVGVRGGYGRGKTAGSLFLGADKDEGVVLFCPPASLLGAPAV